MNRNSVILVCSHKPYPLPGPSCILKPIHVGRANANEETKNKLSGALGDNTGENISTKNPWYAELTAIYWAWKNLQKLGNPENIGLAHYRRFLAFGAEDTTGKKNGEPIDVKISDESIERAMQGFDIAAPIPWKLGDKTLVDFYEETHYGIDLKKVMGILKEQNPEMAKAADETLQAKETQPCNMFIMKASVFDKYCSVLFGALSTFEAQSDFANDPKYKGQQQRVAGFLGERITDCFIRYCEQTGMKITRAPIVMSEPDKDGNLRYQVNNQEPTYEKPVL